MILVGVLWDGGARWPEAGRVSAQGAAEPIRLQRGNAPESRRYAGRRMPGYGRWSGYPSNARLRKSGATEDEGGLRGDGDLIHGILQRREWTDCARARQPSSVYLGVR